MATVVNNADRGEGSWGPVVIAIVVILAAIAFVVWGMPAIQGTGGDTNIQLPDVNVPAAPAAPGAGAGATQ